MSIITKVKVQARTPITTGKKIGTIGSQIPSVKKEKVMVDTTIAEETHIIIPATLTTTLAITTIILVTLTATLTPLMETQATILHILPTQQAGSVRAMSPNLSSSSTSAVQP